MGDCLLYETNHVYRNALHLATNDSTRHFLGLHTKATEMLDTENRTAQSAQMYIIIL